MESNNQTTLVDEKVAISLFLDSLLRETEVDSCEAVTATEEITNVTPLKLEIAETVELKTHEKTDIADKYTEVEVTVATDSVSQVEEQTVAAKKDWTEEPFQALLFNVAGLNLAIPLVELNGVIKWSDNTVTEMPGHADFYMGLLQYLGHKIPVVDTAKMVFPVNKQTQLIGDNPRKRVKHIVLIGEYQWGLACDKIGEVITLEPQDVRWRATNNSRTWLAGTVIEHMCALLNGEGFAEMLKSGKA